MYPVTMTCIHITTAAVERRIIFPHGSKQLFSLPFLSCSLSLPFFLFHFHFIVLFLPFPFLYYLPISSHFPPFPPLFFIYFSALPVLLGHFSSCPFLSRFSTSHLSLPFTPLLSPVYPRSAHGISTMLQSQAMTSPFLLFFF